MVFGKDQKTDGKNNPFYGRHHTDRAKEKLRKKTIERYSIKDENGKSINNSMYGKHHTEETKRKISKVRLQGLKEGRIIPIWKGKKLSKQHCKNISLAKKGKTRSNESKRKQAEGIKKLWQDKNHKYNSIGYMNKMILAGKNKWRNEKIYKKIIKNMNLKPNIPEKVLINLFKKEKLQYKYVGDGKFWIEGRNPDFINVNGQKKIIELFGDYWHSEKHLKRKNKLERSETNTLKHYKKYGYSTLIIWERELKNVNNVLGKIRRFG